MTEAANSTNEKAGGASAALRAELRGMVEQNWREMLTERRKGPASYPAAERIARDFGEKNMRMAKRMGAEGTEFLRVLTEENNIALNAYRADQEAFERRIGMSVPVPVANGEVIKAEATFRAEIRSMVEKNWREFMIEADKGPQGQPAANKIIQDFSDRIKLLGAEITSKSGPEGGNEFFRVMLEERQIAQDAVNADPEAFKRRIGMPLAGTVRAPEPALDIPKVKSHRRSLYDTQERRNAIPMTELWERQQSQGRRSNRQPMGEMIVRTAVRATVWDLVRKLLR